MRAGKEDAEFAKIKEYGGDKGTTEGVRRSETLSPFFFEPAPYYLVL